MLLGLLGAAAIAAQQPAPPVGDDPDLRCMVAMSILLNHMSENTQAAADEKTGVISIFMYYVGKIDGRISGFDYAGEVKKLIETPGYEKKLAADLQRCGNEAEARSQSLIELGEKLKNLEPLAESSFG